MKMQIQFLSDWRIWIGIVSACSFLFSVFNLIVGRHVANKIVGNDLKHLTSDVKEIKEEHKEIKINLRDDLNKIFRRLGKIDKSTAVQRAVCDERHKKDK